VAQNQGAHFGPDTRAGNGETARPAERSRYLSSVMVSKSVTIPVTEFESWITRESNSQYPFGLKIPMIEF
jgi:hypothetical protein